MKKIFVDTGAWVAFFDEDDSLHGEAVSCLEDIKTMRCNIVISDFIFDEAVTSVLAHAGHHMAVAAGEFLMSSAVVDIVWLDQAMKLRAWDYFMKHDDKRYSFTDCTSFALMKEMKMTHYLAFDKHFEQAGFRRYR